MHESGVLRKFASYHITHLYLHKFRRLFCSEYSKSIIIPNPSAKILQQAFTNHNNFTCLHQHIYDYTFKLDQIYRHFPIFEQFIISHHRVCRWYSNNASNLRLCVSKIVISLNILMVNEFWITQISVVHDELWAIVWLGMKIFLVLEQNVFSLDISNYRQLPLLPFIVDLPFKHSWTRMFRLGIFNIF